MKLRIHIKIIYNYISVNTDNLLAQYGPAISCFLNCFLMKINCNTIDRSAVHELNEISSHQGADIHSEENVKFGAGSPRWLTPTLVRDSYHHFVPCCITSTSHCSLHFPCQHHMTVLCDYRCTLRNLNDNKLNEQGFQL